MGQGVQGGVREALPCVDLGGSAGTPQRGYEINREAFRTCYFYTVMRFKGEPGSARGILRAFTLVQLAQIHAMAVREAAKTTEFVERIMERFMEMRLEDLLTCMVRATEILKWRRGPGGIFWRS